MRPTPRYAFHNIPMTPEGDSFMAALSEYVNPGRYRVRTRFNGKRACVNVGYVRKEDATSRRVYLDDAPEWKSPGASRIEARLVEAQDLSERRSRDTYRAERAAVTLADEVKRWQARTEFAESDSAAWQMRAEAAEGRLSYASVALMLVSAALLGRMVAEFSAWPF